MNFIIKSKRLLEIVQCLYQQKVISKEDKNKLVAQIQDSLKTNKTRELKELLETIECLKPDKEYLFVDALDLLRKGENL